MLNNIVIGSYYPVKSKIHFMNPVNKMLCTILFIVTSFLCKDPKIMLLLTFLCVLMAELGHLPKSIYFKTFKNLRLLIVLLAILYYFMGVDLDTVICVILRLLNIVLYTTVLTLTTAPTELTYGLQKVLGIFKIVGLPVNKMALSLSLALRFIPTIIDQGNKILKSQASRGIDYYASRFGGKVMAIKSMIIPMFILTIRRADILSESMQFRLYDINAKRTNFKVSKISFFDIFIFVIHAGILGVIIARMVIK